MHAQASRPIQFILWEASVCVTTELSGSGSETLATLGSDIPLEPETSEDTPPKKTSDPVPEETSEDDVQEEVSLFLIFFTGFEEEDALEELAAGGLLAGLEDTAAFDETAGGGELEVRSGK